MELFTIKFVAMASPCTLYLYSDNKNKAQAIAELAKQDLKRFQNKYSRYNPDSLVSKINEYAGTDTPVKLDDQTIALINYADTAWKMSNGIFDITSGCLRKVWDFKKKQIPDSDKLEECLQNVGWQKVKWEAPYILLPHKGMEIDFGGFGKEYIADYLANYIRALGIDRGLVDLGGDVAIIGSHPGDKPWSIGIRDPSSPQKASHYVSLYSGGIATSGDYERGFFLDGRYYSHLIDPRTGQPSDGFASVTVVADQALVAGTASSVAMLHGTQEGKNWLESLELEYLCFERN